MGSISVFLSLQELFPQVDPRILKAVAIEHSKDVDAAAEFVLSEVLTSRSEQSDEVPSREQDNALYNQGAETMYTSHHSKAIAISSESASVAVCPFSGEVLDVLCNSYVGGSVEQHPPLTPHFPGDVVEVSRKNYVDWSEEQGSMMPHQEVASQPFESKEADTKTSDSTTNASHLKSSYLDDVVTTSVENNPDQLNEKPEESSPTVHKIDSNREFEEELSGDFCANVQDLNKSQVEEKYEASMEHEADEGKYITSSFGPREEQLLGDASTVSTGTCAGDNSLPIHGESNDVLQVEIVVPKNVSVGLVESYDNYSIGRTDKIFEQSTCGTEMVSLDEYDLPMTISTRSGHIVNIDLLEDFVTEARSNKQNLVSSVEVIINMVQESEVLEERAKQAKEEASWAGQAALTNAEELKQILKHAKHANDMRAGDIYGEKAILSAEARELQSRLLSLSNERNRSFLLTEEIRQTLEARIAAAKDEIAAAEQEKLQVEEESQKALKEHEAAMDIVLEESKRLQHDAEENAKLREFLIERGQVVDALQGELAVIFEDVILLKEKVDGCLPLGRSLMTAYSSSSSSSSSTQRSVSLSKSPAANRDDQVSWQKRDTSSLENSVEAINTTNSHEAPEDEDWELCNSQA